MGSRSEPSTWMPAAPVLKAAVPEPKFSCLEMQLVLQSKLRLSARRGLEDCWPRGASSSRFGGWRAPYQNQKAREDDEAPRPRKELDHTLCFNFAYLLRFRPVVDDLLSCVFKAVAMFGEICRFNIEDKLLVLFNPGVSTLGDID